MQPSLVIEGKTTLCPQDVCDTWCLWKCTVLHSCSKMSHQKDQVPKAEQISNISMRCPPHLAQHICVWFSMKCGDPPAITMQKVRRCFGDLAYSKPTVCRWHKSFREGRNKVGDLFRGGNRSARTDRNIQNCAKILAKSRRQTVHQLSRKSKLSYGTVLHILHHDLELTKRSAKLIPTN